MRVESKGEQRFWTCAGSDIIVGSTLPEVVRSITDPQLSFGALAAAASPRASLWLTPFEGVHRLTFGHELRATSAGPRVTRWFMPEAETPTTSEPAAVMRRAISNAIETATQGHEGGVVALSGGLDSTVVLALAQRNPRLRAGLRAYCAVPEPSCIAAVPARIADEWPAAAAVAEHVGVPVEAMSGHVDFNWLDVADEYHARHFAPVKAVANMWWLRQLEEQAVHRGTPLILTGQSGNATFSNGRRNALRPLRPDGFWEAQTSSKRMKAALRRVARRHPAPVARPGIPVHMPDHVLDMDPWTRWCLAEPPVPGVGPWTGADVTWCDPLGSAEVIAAAMSMPDDAWGEQRDDRLLAREVGRGLIPEVVRLNRVRGVQGADMPGVMQRYIDSYVEAVERVSSSESARQFLDVRVLTSALSLLRGDLRAARVFRRHYLKPLAAGLFAAWWDDQRRSGRVQRHQPCR